MRISTKIRYGLRAICDLAYQASEVPSQIRQISKRQDISARYLEQIFKKFKKSGIVKSVRGPFGGYLLAREPQSISVGDIIRAIDEEDINLVFCSSLQKPHQKSCKRQGTCVVSDVWEGASRSLMDYFNGITIDQICQQGRERGVGI